MALSFGKGRRRGWLPRLWQLAAIHGGHLLPGLSLAERSRDESHGLTERGQVHHYLLFMEVKQAYVIKFFREEGMKAAEIIDRLDKHFTKCRYATEARGEIEATAFLK
jgi:hypothetical protein